MSTLRGFKSLPDLLVADRESDFGEELGNIRTRRNIWGMRRHIWKYLEGIGAISEPGVGKKESWYLDGMQEKVQPISSTEGETTILRQGYASQSFYGVKFILLFLQISVFGGIWEKWTFSIDKIKVTKTGISYFDNSNKFLPRIWSCVTFDKYWIDKNVYFSPCCPWLYHQPL